MKAIIIDDEKQSIDTLRFLLQIHHPDITIIGTAIDVKSGTKLLQSEQADLLFLDVGLPDGTGFDILEKIDHQLLAIIFITAHNHYARMAIEFAAMAYLNKPIKTKELADAIERAQNRVKLSNLQQQLEDMSQVIEDFRQQRLPLRMAVSTMSGIHYIPITEIIYIRVDNGCVEIFTTTNQRIAVASSLAVYQRKLSEFKQFMRVHKSYIVNLLCVRAYQHDGTAVLYTGDSIPVGKHYLDDFKNELGNL